MKVKLSMLGAVYLVCAVTLAGCATQQAESHPTNQPANESSNVPGKHYDAIVDGGLTGKDGTAINGVKTYKTVKAALDAAPEKGTKPFFIYIKNGTYREKLDITKSYIYFLGQDKDKTILTYDAASDTRKPDGTSTYGTAGSASITVKGSNFTAENLTISNSFDYLGNAKKDDKDPTKLKNAQAVALKTDQGSDHTLIKNCNLLGNQDTLYANSGTQYYDHDTIKGNVDFIFGAGQALFNECEIRTISRGQTSKTGAITAPSTLISSQYGFLFINCKLEKDDPTVPDGSVYLGRPWHAGNNPDAVGEAIFVNTWMDSEINPQGWDKMSSKDKDGKTIWNYPKDARFYEYGSAGPGADKAAKSDSRKFLTSDQAREYTISNVLSGWDPSK